MSTPDFVEFPKIARLSRECVVTEKIDGTNSQIWISDDLTILQAGSRSRWLTLDADNFGFKRWVIEHAEELIKLGPGRHFGEWWGSGIQRGYGLKEKRFSLFNVIRWCEHNKEPRPIPTQDPTAAVKMQERLPACVSLVPELYRGLFDTQQIQVALDGLLLGGSAAAPGFLKPEGIVVFHIAGNVGFKKTIERDETPKLRARGNRP
jgi:hypothetical protein